LTVLNEQRWTLNRYTPWKFDPCFESNSLRVQHPEILENEIETVLQHEATDQWIAKFGTAGVSVSPVNTIE